MSLLLRPTQRSTRIRQKRIAGRHKGGLSGDDQRSAVGSVILWACVMCHGDNHGEVGFDMSGHSIAIVSAYLSRS